MPCVFCSRKKVQIAFFTLRKNFTSSQPHIDYNAVHESHSVVNNFELALKLLCNVENVVCAPLQTHISPKYKQAERGERRKKIVCDQQQQRLVYHLLGRWLLSRLFWFWFLFMWNTNKKIIVRAKKIKEEKFLWNMAWHDVDDRDRYTEREVGDWMVRMGG